MVKRADLKDPLSCKSVVADLDDYRACLKDEKPGKEGKDELCSARNGQPGHHAPHSERPRIPEEESRRIGVHPQEPTQDPDEREDDRGARNNKKKYAK